LASALPRGAWQCRDGARLVARCRHLLHAGARSGPDDPITNRALGDFYLKRGIGSLAIPEYEKAVELDSTDIDLRFALGKALAYDERYEDAIAQYRWVAEQNPDFPGAQLALGDIFYRAGKAKPAYYAEARPFLEKYTTLMPNDRKGWSLLGRDYYALRMRDEAGVAMQKAVDLGDKSKELYTNMFRLMVERKEWQKALDMAALAEPSTSDMVKLAQVHAFMGNTTAADSTYRAIIGRDSLSSDGKFAMLEMAKMQFRAKDYPTAIGTLGRRIALERDFGRGLLLPRFVHEEMRALPEAIAALRQSAALEPTKGDRHFWLAVTLTQADSIDAGIAEFEATVAVDSTSKNAGVAHQQLGYRNLLKKDWGGAVDHLERAVAIDGRNLQSLIWLAQAHQNSGIVRRRRSTTARCSRSSRGRRTPRRDSRRSGCDPGASVAPGSGGRGMANLKSRMVGKVAILTPKGYLTGGDRPRSSSVRSRRWRRRATSTSSST
jgi:tetratricopeptide (TPR) repeat protein